MVLVTETPQSGQSEQVFPAVTILLKFLPQEQSKEYKGTMSLHTK